MTQISKLGASRPRSRISNSIRSIGLSLSRNWQIAAISNRLSPVPKVSTVKFNFLLYQTLCIPNFCVRLDVDVLLLFCSISIFISFNQSHHAIWWTQNKTICSSISRALIFQHMFTAGRQGSQPGIYCIFNNGIKIICSTFDGLSFVLLADCTCTLCVLNGECCADDYY